MWLYVQKTGNLYDHDGKLVSTGYSGHGPGLNAPEFQAVKNVGPLPCGFYIINPPKDTESHGPFVMALTPFSENEMYGRGGMLLHGDRKVPGHEASSGCIVLDRVTRAKIWNSGDRDLEVTSFEKDKA